MGIKSKNIIDSIRRNRPYFEDLVTRSVYHSNAIEGNTISYAETYAIIFNSNDLKVNALPRELYEAINLKYGLSYVLKHVNDDITLNYIKRLGIFINKNISDISDFRNTQVFIRGAQHIPPKACDVKRLLMEIMYEYKNSSDELFLRLSKMHISFERIHPFIDGNGRVGRLLITKELIKNNNSPLVIPFELRAEYMNYLSNQDVYGLAQFLNKLSMIEQDRMLRFGIKTGE